MGQIFVHSGLHEKILLDQGQNFESKLVADLCKLMGNTKDMDQPIPSAN